MIDGMFMGLVYPSLGCYGVRPQWLKLKALFGRVTQEGFGVHSLVITRDLQEVRGPRVSLKFGQKWLKLKALFGRVTQEGFGVHSLAITRDLHEAEGFPQVWEKM
ncbi:hypothetical protein PIB30_070543 [Stylosanthes scabra]|uniref:Uncharacterized protein n=1 Tax=Stylosanthes scabra TaxID=79078 RepID=A0ABU6VLY1_9FABA|nr:hypothetical protein [Stylosanthes scabra]